MSSSRLRVLIVDDDPTYRQILTRTFEQLPGVESVAVAPNLAVARSKLEQGGIDVVSIDVVLRDESGLDLLKWIQEKFTQVFTILLTSGAHREASQSVDALLLGASTLIIKPSGESAPAELRKSLQTALLAAVRAEASQPSAIARLEPRLRSEAATREVIAVGASTGGPPVVMQLLLDLPPSFDVPILITQHMPTLHIPYFVELLARQSRRQVVLGKHGARVQRGMVYVAGGGKHLLVSRAGGVLFLAQSSGPEEHNCRPAVDPMFRSVAQACGPACVGVVMTGMGSDGCLGALALRERGAPVVAQDRESSIVWGMPGAVANAGAATAVVPGKELAHQVVRFTAANGVQS